MEVSRRGRYAQSRALPAPIPNVGKNQIGNSKYMSNGNNNYIKNNNNMKKAGLELTMTRIWGERIESTATADLMTFTRIS